jgi:hypothetical protein
VSAIVHLRIVALAWPDDLQRSLLHAQAHELSRSLSSRTLATMAARMTLYKLVVLGDGGVGKVCQVLNAGESS